MRFLGWQSLLLLKFMGFSRSQKRRRIKMMLIRNYYSPCTAVMALASLSVTMAYRDNNLYQGGKSNPNLEKHPMYRAGPANVLEGLDAGDFQALFLEYYGCVWSEFDDGSEGTNAGCSGGDDNEEFWYMGRTECFRANAAYALYGISQDDEFPENGNGCGKKQYINSFFTNYGVGSFISALDLSPDDYGVNFYCNLDYDGEKYGDASGGSSPDNNVLLYPNSTSYTTGCTRAGRIIQARFTGAYCNGREFEGIIDTLDDLNSAISNVTSNSCLQIYAAPSDNSTNSSNHGSAAVGDEESLYGLLFYSVACNFYEYPDRCPDPYGLKQAVDSGMIPKALGWTSKINFLHWPKLLIYVFLLGGMILSVMTSRLDGTIEDLLKKRKKRLQQLERQGRTPKDTIGTKVRDAGEYLQRTFSLGKYRTLTFPKRRDQR